MLAGFAASACGHKRAPRYQGWLFAASGGEKAIAVADLSSFRPLTAIPLPLTPDQLFHSGERVFVTCRDGRALIEIDIERFRVSGRMALPGKPVMTRLLPDGISVIIATEEPAAILVVDLLKRRVTARLPLPGAPADLDVSARITAATIPGRNSVVRFSMPEMKLAGMTDIGMPCRPVRFRNDGQTIFMGAAEAREIVALNAASGNLLARLPLAFSPSRFCFNADGGQMFVTGNGADALAIVNAYENEVDQTILAGRTPDAMAVSNNRLFITNRDSGDLTILDIDTRRVAASIHVGENPDDVLITPGGEYALAIDRRSGNVSVVRIPAVLGSPRDALRTKPLFTVFPTAADARSAIIVPYRAGS